MSSLFGRKIVLALGFILLSGLCGCTRYDSGPFLIAYNYSIACTDAKPTDPDRQVPGNIDNSALCPSAAANASPGGAAGAPDSASSSTQSTTTETDVKKTVTTANGVSTTTTTTTTTAPAPAAALSSPTKPTAPAFAIKACPDPPGTAIYTPGSSATAPGKFSPCAAAVIRAGINYCVRSTLTQDFYDMYLQEGEIGFTTATVAAASGAAAVAGATAPVSIGIGVSAGIITAAGSTLSKLLPSAPPQATVTNLVTAATQYISITDGTTTASSQPNPSSPAFDSTDPQKLQLTLKSTDHSWRYYAGLWNAVGAACSPDVFKAATHPSCTGKGSGLFGSTFPPACP